MIEVLRNALEALENVHEEIVHNWPMVIKNNQAIASLREVIKKLEEEHKNEPNNP